MPKVETFNREQVLQHVTDVFHDKGYNATSMQDLVNATGLNRSSIYNSFDSKLNLFIECLNRYQSTYYTKTTHTLLKASTPLNAIELFFEMHLNEVAIHNDERGCMVVNCKSEMANHEAAITQFLNKNQEEMLQLFEDLVSKGQQQKLINDQKTAREYALFLYSSLQGLKMTGILISNKQDLKSIIQTIIQTLI